MTCCIQKKHASGRGMQLHYILICFLKHLKLSEEKNMESSAMYTEVLSVRRLKRS